MKKEVSNILKNLINIPSFGKVPTNHAIFEYLEHEFSSCKEIVKVIDEMGNAHLLIGVNTNLQNVGNAFLFSGHIDTVPESVEHRAIANMFDGKIAGLGSADMKGFIASLIANIESFQKINKPIIISLTSDEETDFYGIENILLEMNKRKIIPSAVIIGEPTLSNVACAHRGNSIFVSEVVGKACHSSIPEMGINAINLSMEAISQIEHCIEQYQGKASICITKIEGGKACNIVPDLCKTTISVRTSSPKYLKSISNELQNIYKDINDKAVSAKITEIFTIPAFENNDGKLREVFGCIDEIEFKGASEAGFIQQRFREADMLIYGPGDPNCIHKAGEELDVNELNKYTNSLPYVVTKFFNMQKENNHDLQL